MRATVRVGLYTGAKVYFVHEVQATHTHMHTRTYTRTRTHKGSSSLTCHDIANEYNTGTLKPMRDLCIIKPLKNSGFSHPQRMFMCAAGLPGSGRWRRTHSPRHMGECVHDASAGE